MQWRDLNRNPTVNTLRGFGIFTMLFLSAIAVSQLWRGNETIAVILVVIAVLFGALGIVRPGLLRSVFVASLVITFPLGWVVSKTLLCMLFFTVFTPLGLLFRLFGRDVLGLRHEPDRTTYWSDKTTSRDVRGYFRQY